jgi:hypothetical protein
MGFIDHISFVRKIQGRKSLLILIFISYILWILSYTQWKIIGINIEEVCHNSFAISSFLKFILSGKHWSYINLLPITHCSINLVSSFRVHYPIFDFFACWVSQSNVKLADRLRVLPLCVLLNFLGVTQGELVWFYWKLVDLSWRGKVESWGLNWLWSEWMLDGGSKLLWTATVFLCAFFINNLHLLHFSLNHLQYFSVQSYFDSADDVFDRNLAFLSNLSDFLCFFNFEFEHFFL